MTGHSKRFPFTKRTIEAIPPHDPDSPSREAEYSDAECIGLHLRVSKNGRRFFQHRYRHLGRKKCLSLGEYPHVSIQDARQRVSEHKALLARDIDPGDERAQKRNDITFSAFAKDFYIPHAKMHKKTWQEDVWKIQRQLEPAFGKHMLSSITPRDISTFHNKEKQRTSATTANHHMTLIKRMFNLAVKWGLLEKSPAAGLDKFKEPPHRERYLTKEELPKFLRALEYRRTDYRWRPSSCSCSPGAEGTRSCPFNGAGEIGREAPLPAGHQEWPFPIDHPERQGGGNSQRTGGSEGPSPPDPGQCLSIPLPKGSRKPHMYDLRNPFEKTCEAAGIEGLRIHDLRHSFATLAIQGGASLYDVQKLLGHSDISMTQRYAHMVDESLQRATDNMAGVIDRAIGG